MQHVETGIKLADRHTVSGRLLETVYETELKKALGEISGCMATVAVDGWSNICNEPVIGISLIVNGSTYLIDTKDTTGHPHTAEYLLEISKEEFEKVEREFKVKVGSMVTDGVIRQIWCA